MIACRCPGRTDAVAGHRHAAGACSWREQLQRLRRFQRIYNDERPHQALGNDTPAKHYAASPRAFDGILREPNYRADHAIRRVRYNGEIRWQGNTVYISAALLGEPVGLIENAADGWTVCYGPIVLGVIAHGGDRLRKPQQTARGLVDNGVGDQYGAAARQHQRDAHDPMPGLGIDAAPHVLERHGEIARDAGDHGIGVAERDHAGGEMIAVLVDQALTVALQEAVALQPFVEISGIGGIAR